jgi:hypothetical protein
MIMNKRPELLIALIFLVLMLFVGVWWLPQKWATCKKLYDNTLAQIICFSES